MKCRFPRNSAAEIAQGIKLSRSLIRQSKGNGPGPGPTRQASTELTKCSVASVLIGVLLDNLGLNLPHGFFSYGRDCSATPRTGGQAFVEFNERRTSKWHHLWLCIFDSKGPATYQSMELARSSSLMADRMRAFAGAQSSTP